MPTQSLLTSTPRGYIISSLFTLVANLRNSATADKPINAADLDQMITAVRNTWIAHTHKYNDLLGIDTFGNLTRYTTTGSYSNDLDTGAALDIAGNGYAASPTPAGITPGGQITAADINAVIALINGLRNHRHGKADLVGQYNPSVNILSGTYYNDATYYVPITATVTQTITMGTDGRMSYLAYNTTTSQIGSWLSMDVPSTIAAEYEILASYSGVSAGASVSGPFGSWVQLGVASRSFILTSAGPDGQGTCFGTATFNFKFRRVGTTIDLADVNLVVSANNTNWNVVEPPAPVPPPPPAPVPPPPPGPAPGPPHQPPSPPTQEQ